MSEPAALVGGPELAADGAGEEGARRSVVTRLGQRVPYIVLHAAICRRELCIEIDGVHE